MLESVLIVNTYIHTYPPGLPCPHTLSSSFPSLSLHAPVPHFVAQGDADRFRGEKRAWPSIERCHGRPEATASSKSAAFRRQARESGQPAGPLSCQLLTEGQHVPRQLVSAQRPPLHCPVASFPPTAFSPPLGIPGAPAETGAAVGGAHVRLMSAYCSSISPRAFRQSRLWVPLAEYLSNPRLIP